MNEIKNGKAQKTLSLCIHVSVCVGVEGEESMLLEGDEKDQKNKYQTTERFLYQNN